MRFFIAATCAMAVFTAPAWADTPQSLLDQAMLLGPAQLGDAGGQLTIYGQAGTATYSVDLTGSDCRVGAAGCDQLRFTSFAPPADQAAIDAWNGAGHGGTLTLDQGWLWLSAEVAVAGDASSAFAGWNTLLGQFAAQFDG